MNTMTELQAILHRDAISIERETFNRFWNQKLARSVREMSPGSTAAIQHFCWLTWREFHREGGK